jgi:DNA-binding HxlR family transcriptional regulator
MRLQFQRHKNGQRDLPRQVDDCYLVRDGPVRLGELTRLIPDASKKVLLENLKRLEATGIVVRNDFSQRVLHVEYDFNECVRETICQLL